MHSLLLAISMTALRLSEPLTVDGQLADAIYPRAAWSEAFAPIDRESETVNGLYEKVEEKFRTLETRVAAFVHGDDLYLAVEAPFPADVKPVAKSKSRFGGDRLDFYAVQVNGFIRLSLGADGKVSAARIDGKSLAAKPLQARGVRGRAVIGESALYGEMKVPLDVVGVKKDGRLRCNFVRAGESCGGLSTWAPVGRDLLVKERFGQLVVGTGDEKAAVAADAGDDLVFRAFHPWSNEVEVPDEAVKCVRMSGPRGARAVGSFYIRNQTDRPALYNLDVVSKDRELVRHLRIRQMDYLELRGGPTIPDPIFDLPLDAVIRVAPGAATVVWLDADCSKVSPGRHEGEIVFVPGYGKFSERKVPVELEVFKADVSEIDQSVWGYPLRGADRIRDLRDYGVNTTLLHPPYYPMPDAQGNCNYKMLDDEIAAFLENGIRKEHIRLMLYPLIQVWCKTVVDTDGTEYTFPSPGWAAVFAKRFPPFLKHLKERHGIGTDQVYFFVNDEPSGDPDDPKTSAYAAVKGAEFIRQYVPGIRTVANPWQNEPEYLDAYVKNFDVIVPFLRQMMDKRNEYESLIRRYAKCGRDIWSYTIYVKENTPHQYRQISWAHVDFGFQGPAVYYDFWDCSGDSFNSYDGKGADYNGMYRNERTNRSCPSRRMEAWYQGVIDQKLAKWCIRRLAQAKKAGKDVSVLAEELRTLVKEGNSHAADYADLRERLLAFSDKCISANK